MSHTIEGSPQRPSGLLRAFDDLIRAPGNLVFPAGAFPAAEARFAGCCELDPVQQPVLPPIFLGSTWVGMVTIRLPGFLPWLDTKSGDASIVFRSATTSF